MQNQEKENQMVNYRDIKFRAWDTLGKRFIGEFKLQEFRFLAQAYHLNLEYLQYTGLKDKNGKEIYESDRVEFNPLGSTEIKEGLVEWYKEGWVIDDGINKFELWSGVFGKPSIIGNKYEN